MFWAVLYDHDRRASVERGRCIGWMRTCINNNGACTDMANKNHTSQFVDQGAILLICVDEVPR